MIVSALIKSNINRHFSRLSAPQLPNTQRRHIASLLSTNIHICAVLAARRQAQVDFFYSDCIESIFWKTSDSSMLMSLSNLPQVPPFIHFSMLIYLFAFPPLPCCPSLLSVFLCARSPDPWPTGRQLPACLSFATKLLYIMAWSPAMQRGFMALEHAEWYLLSPGDLLGSPGHLQQISKLHKLLSLCFGFGSRAT